MTSIPAAFGVFTFIALAGCASVDYVGRSYPPTSHVDVFFSEADVQRPFEVMGEAVAQIDAIPFTSQGAALQQKLEEEARARGADAILLGPLAGRTVGVTQQTVGEAKEKGKKKVAYRETTTTQTEDMVELRGSLLKYRGTPARE